MKCHICAGHATVCGHCYGMLLEKYESLLAWKNKTARECHELQAENTMLRMYAFQAAERIHAQSELLSKRSEG